jgi:hypothetical protein
MHKTKANKSLNWTIRYGLLCKEAELKYRLTLSFSNSDLHILQYKEYVKCSLRFAKRLGRSSLFSEFSIESTNRPTNDAKEYWYMGSMLASSAIVKNSIVEWIAIGL